MTKAPAQRLEPRIPASELKDRLLTFARATGFDSCRITTCGSPPHKDEFQNWLDEGGHGEMSYMERGKEKRCDPQKLLPGASSIVVLELNYFQGQMQPSH